MFSSIPGFYPLPASSTTPLLVTTQINSRHCQMPLRGIMSLSHSSLRITGLYKGFSANSGFLSIPFDSRNHLSLKDRISVRQRSIASVLVDSTRLPNHWLIGIPKYLMRDE
ncbi:unnamed protein product [Rangifer tarandus platyrhynchus]|uniref:Uncharacterized protein n=1 Tax=Rangifer tarandus platyrhynchus TaxID=3082113 RepID=A0ABN8Y8B2_RANTA|nr:unnamed protein product [Rangifer tarandus platyrhynchus]